MFTVLSWYYMTEAITPSLWVSELIGERENPANYKYGRMCSRAGREAWVTTWESQRKEPTVKPRGFVEGLRGEEVLGWITNYVSGEEEAFLRSQKQHEAHLRIKFLPSVSDHHSESSTLSDCKALEKHKRLFLLLVSCCCYYPLIRGLKGLF